MARRRCKTVYYTWKGRNPAEQIPHKLAKKIVGEKKLQRARARVCRPGRHPVTTVRPLTSAKHYSDGVIVSTASRYDKPL